jgi:hypothetical protein
MLNTAGFPLQISAGKRSEPKKKLKSDQSEGVNKKVWCSISGSFKGK